GSGSSSDGRCRPPLPWNTRSAAAKPLPCPRLRHWLNFGYLRWPRFGWLRRGARRNLRTQGPQPLLESFHSLFQGRVHDHNIPHRQNDALQFGYSRGTGRYDVNRLHVEDGSAYRQHDNPPPKHVRPLLVPKCKLSCNLGILIDQRADLRRAFDLNLAAESIEHDLLGIIGTSPGGGSAGDRQHAQIAP